MAARTWIIDAAIQMVDAQAACHAIVVTQPVVYDRKLASRGGESIATLGLRQALH